MDVTVLGGRAAAAAAGVGCSGYLVRTDQTTLVVDLGTDTLTELLRQVAIPDITAVVISHGHPDHTLDLIGLHDAVAYGLAPVDPVPLWLPPGAKHMLTKVGSLFSGGSDGDDWLATAFVADTYRPEETLRFGDIALTFRKTQHAEACWAIRMDAPDGSVGYTADTGSYGDLVDHFRDVDLLISEATYGRKEPARPRAERPHLTLADAATLARECGAQRLLLAHTLDPDSAGLGAAAERLVRVPVDVARPGLAIPIGGAQ